MAKRVTIKDVASEVGLSASTVSIVLNGKGASVPKKTQDRIFAAAEKLHYTPNQTARSLVIGKTSLIGVIVPSVTNVFFAELVRWLQKKFVKYGYDIVLSNNEERVDKDIKYVNLLAGRNIDGLVIAPSAQSLLPENEGELMKNLQDLSVPFLFMDRYVKGYPHVAIDNVESGYAIADHLRKSGHQKIGVVTGPLQLNSSKNRLKGFSKRLAEDGIVLAPEYVYEGQYDIETGELAARKLMETDVTAICVFSDMQAYGVYKALRAMGKRIPEDVSVAGFDDNVFSELLECPLTTMRQPLEELAEATVQTMLQMLDGKVQENQKLSAVLIERESVKKI